MGILFIVLCCVILFCVLYTIGRMLGFDDPYGRSEAETLAQHRAVEDKRRLTLLCQRHGELEGVAMFERERHREEMEQEKKDELDRFVNLYLQERNKRKV